MYQRVKVAKTTTPLGANATWYSLWFYIGDSQYLTFGVVADQAGTLYFELADGSTTVIGRHSWSVSANTPLTDYRFSTTEFARVKYINGATAQTSFQLVVYKVIT